MKTKNELMWQCKKCKKIGGYANYNTTREEVNAHTPKCRHCHKKASWEPLVVEVKTFL